MIKLKVHHIAVKKRRISFSNYSTLDALRKAGVTASKEELEVYMQILSDVELCGQIKLNLPRTKRMQRWLDKRVIPN